ncbi:MAG: hypothetical protein MUP45_01220 [Candidatus Marinimicrobia bacterium]|nr:hypothetical protein [Candidatus Neomarinimicrobiota bacterium]
MNKERYFVRHSGPKNRLITVAAPDFQPDQPVPSQSLLDLIKDLRNNYPKTLIQVRTPKMTGSQLESLFDAGANGFTLLTETEKSSPT